MCRYFPLMYSVLAWLLFAAIIIGFYTTDFYTQRFDASGVSVALYNAARLLFIPLFGWLIAAPGYWVMPRNLPFFLAFFTGAGLWTLGMLVAGLAGLYYPLAAISVALTVFALSIPTLAAALSNLHVKAKSIAAHAPITKVMIALLILSVLAFVQVKAIYPSGWHDYFSHYFFYYREVVQSGSLLPNQVWYHFFYSKGGGLYFLAMMLTDPLAPALVTASFVGVSGMMVVALVRRYTAAMWAFAACVLYFGLQIYIRGAGYGSWGQLPKFHELTAAIMLFLVWASITLPEQEKSAQAFWQAAMIMASVAAVIFTLVMGVIIGLFFALLMVLAWKRKQRDIALHYFVIGLSTALAMIAICLVNQHYTGIPTDYLFGIWHGAFDWEKIRHWGIEFELQANIFERTHVSAVEWSPNLLVRFFYRFLRLDLLYVVLAVALCSAFVLCKKPAITLPRDSVVYGALIFATLAFAYGLAAGNPVSFYRFSSFAFAPMLCFSFYLLARSKCTTFAPAFGAFVVVMAVMAASYSRYEKSDVTGSIGQAARFAMGRISIDDAYSTQFALPADAKAQGVIHPAARAAYNVVGAHTRIWAFTPYNYCLLPNCGVETHISFRLTKRPDIVFHGTAEATIAQLKLEKLDYFLITTSLEIRDPLPKTTLFSPQHIAKYLQMKWTDGDSALLTWPAHDTQPISKKWLEKYTKAVAESTYVQHYSLDEIRKIPDSH